MIRYKLVFVALILVLALLLVFKVHPLRVFSEFKTPHRYPMLITEILGNKLIFKTKNKTYYVTNSQFNLPSSAQVESDIQTTYQFAFAHYLITASPSSSLFYNLRTRELNMQEGSFEWRGYGGDQETTVYLNTQKNILRLSDRGKVALDEREIRIWNYEGDTRLFHNQGDINLPSAHYVAFPSEPDGRPLQVVSLLRSPQEIFPGYPETFSLILKNPSDTIINFSWQAVRNSDRYILNIYSDPLRDNLIFSQNVESNNLIKNLVEFIDIARFYWEVVPFDAHNQLAGIPSPMGVIHITGRALNESSALIKPRLAIESIEISGRVVEISGQITPDSQLFIEDEPVDVDPEGKFFHRITFNRSGSYRINFRVLSPYNVETKHARSVYIR